MAKNDGDKGKTPGKDVKKGPGAIARALACLVLVALLGYILYGTALRLESVRRHVCDRISSAVGARVEAGSSMLGIPFSVVLKDVKTEGYESGGPGFMFQELVLSPRPGAGWHVSCHRGSVRLVRGGDGSWAPGGLAALGALPEGDLSLLSRFTADFCRGTTLDAADLTVRWVGADGEVAAAGGVTFSVRPAEVSDRSMLHHALVAASVVGPGGVRAVDVRREWLADKGLPYRELVREGGEAAGKGVFWEGTKQ